MTVILQAAIVMVALCVVFVLCKWPLVRCEGRHRVSLLTFIAILFTSGLDMGLIIFPLTEFPTYETEAAYAFTNPLAIEFGFWGFLVWGLYFLTTFYFCVLEPRLGFFEIPAVRLVNNVVIIATCAFTAFLFLENIAWYAPEVDPLWYYLGVLLIISLAAYSSTELRYVRILSLASTYLFFGLIVALGLAGDTPLVETLGTTGKISGYFTNLHRFVLPMSDHHAFYLYWWFAWSIMIGQFVSQFVPRLRTYQLLVVMLVLPSIPLAIWFTVLYTHHLRGVELEAYWKVVLVGIGILFVINSVDSLTRLYSKNLDWTVERLGRRRYLTLHIALMGALVLLYRYTPLQIEWVGLVVIALYLGVLGMTLHPKIRMGSVLERS